MPSLSNERRVAIREFGLKKIEDEGSVTFADLIRETAFMFNISTRVARTELEPIMASKDVVVLGVGKKGYCLFSKKAYAEKVASIPRGANDDSTNGLG